MHAEDMAEQFPVVTLETDVLVAARLLAERRLPGIVVTDEHGQPAAMLSAAGVVRALVPSYIQDDPSLARVLNESLADHLVDQSQGQQVGALVSAQHGDLPRVRAGDTIMEIAAVLASTSSPLVAVMDGNTLYGVITSSRLLELALAPH